MVAIRFLTAEIVSELFDSNRFHERPSIVYLIRYWKRVAGSDSDDFGLQNANGSLTTGQIEFEKVLFSQKNRRFVRYGA